MKKKRKSKKEQKPKPTNQPGKRNWAERPRSISFSETAGRNRSGDTEQFPIYACALFFFSLAETGQTSGRTCTWALSPDPRPQRQHEAFAFMQKKHTTQHSDVFFQIKLTVCTKEKRKHQLATLLLKFAQCLFWLLLRWTTIYCFLYWFCSTW